MVDVEGANVPLTCRVKEKKCESDCMLSCVLCVVCVCVRVHVCVCAYSCPFSGSLFQLGHLCVLYILSSGLQLVIVTAMWFVPVSYTL